MTQYHARLGLEGPITCVINDCLSCLLTWACLIKEEEKSQLPPLPLSLCHYQPLIILCFILHHLQYKHMHMRLKWAKCRWAASSLHSHW